VFSGLNGKINFSISPFYDFHLFMNLTFCTFSDFSDFGESDILVKVIILPLQ